MSSYSKRKHTYGHYGLGYVPDSVLLKQKVELIEHDLRRLEAVQQELLEECFRVNELHDKSILFQKELDKISSREKAAKQLILDSPLSYRQSIATFFLRRLTGLAKTQLMHTAETFSFEYEELKKRFSTFSLFASDICSPYAIGTINAKAEINGKSIERYTKALSIVRNRGARKDYERAVIASVNGKTRGRAVTTNKAVIKLENCPYCGQPIIEGHFDHIYPVSKGGHASERNTVFVCADCNQQKGALTLAQFIKKSGLDRAIVEARLEQLNKDY